MGLKAERIRLWNARALADGIGGLSKFAENIGRSLSQVSQTIGRSVGKNISIRLARHIEASFGKPDGWLDDPHVDEWLGLSSNAWKSELAIELRDNDVWLSDGEPGSRSEIELLTYYGLLSEFDRHRLVEIARVMAASDRPKT